MYQVEELLGLLLATAWQSLNFNDLLEIQYYSPGCFMMLLVKII